MRIYFTKYCYIFFLSFFFLTPTVHGKDRSCAGHLDRELSVLIACSTLLPVAGWYVGLLLLPEFILMAKQIKLLRAATLASTGDSGASPKTQKRINKFYNRLEKLYPEMELGKDEVIDGLHQFNLHSREMGQCLNVPLESHLFPDKPLKHYLSAQQNYLDEQIAQNEKLANAKIIRKEKNAHEEICYFEDDI